MSNNRRDVLAKVTGKAIYANDIQMPGMVFCKVVRSTIASGRIRSIDTARAEQVPGVLRVFTAKDIPGIPNQPCDGSRPRRPPPWCGWSMRSSPPTSIPSTPWTRTPP